MTRLVPRPQGRYNRPVALERVYELFAAALEQPQEDRIAYVERACGEDHALAERVLGMLGAHDSVPDAFLELPATLAPPSGWGQYELEAPIGEGGMGQVYRGRHQVIGRTVAIKVLNAELLAEPDLVSRFEQEAGVVNAVRHPNIIDVTDFIRLEDPPRLAYVMELLSGAPLSTALKAGPFTSRQTLNVAWQMIDALEAVHAVGIIHRDLKPENVFVVGDLDSDLAEVPSIKILDFGLAKAAGADHRTATGMVMGTPLYMAPEQAAGAEVGPGTDIYAWAEIVYEMMTGQRLFHGDAPSVLEAKLLQPTPNLPADLAGEEMAPLVDLLQRGLDRHPARRPTPAEAKAVLYRLGAQVGGAERTWAAFEVGPNDEAGALGLVRAHRGRPVTTDDAPAAAFEHARDAVAFARALQSRGDAAVRVGLSTGSVYATPDDAEGLASPVFLSALRLMSLADGRRTLLTSTTADQARRAPDNTRAAPQWLSHGHYAFRDLPAPVEVFEVLEPDAQRPEAPQSSHEAWPVDRFGASGWRPGVEVEVPKRADWKLVRRLGEGGFGEAWLARHQTSGDERVFKFGFGEGPRQTLRREVHLLERLRHALGRRGDILVPLGAHLNAEPYYLEAPYLPGGDLATWMASGSEGVPLEVRIDLVAPGRGGGRRRALGGGHPPGSKAS